MQFQYSEKSRDISFFVCFFFSNKVFSSLAQSGYLIFIKGNWSFISIVVEKSWDRESAEKDKSLYN